MASSTRTIPTDIPLHPAATASERLARGGGWWTLLLAGLMLLTVTESLSIAAWSEGLEVVRLAMLGGALLGLMLALTRWDGAFPVVYSLLASIAWIATLFTQLIFSGLTWREGALELFRRNAEWVRALVEGASVADNLIFVTQLSFLGWWIAYLAIWSLFRHQRVLNAVIPSGVALLVNAYYAAAPMSLFLIVFAATVVLLAIRVELARNEARWQMTRVRYPPDITFDFLKAGLAFTVIVIVIAWTMPNLTRGLTVERLLRPFEAPWQEVEETWNRMYQSLNYGQASAPVSTFGKTMAFGGPVRLTDRPIYEVVVTERSYWRAATYDRYSSQGWDNTAPDVVVIEADESMGEPVLAATKEVTATVFALERGQDLIVAPPQPDRISVPVTADFRSIPDPLGSDEPARSVTLLRSRVPIGQDAPYQVVSKASDVSPERLRLAGTAYPDWIGEQYLQLPDSLPQRVRDLSSEITALAANPFDKAAAVEQYLRTFTYNQGIAAPPAGQDGVDYFLFDVREGYCDYYASAMVVLLRSAGVPARFVVGYTPGELIETNATADGSNRYSVLERNAHAWPEVYFPSYGWVQFEPTASEPQLVRPSDKPAEPADDQLSREDFRDIMDEFTDSPEPEIPEGVETVAPVQPAIAWFERNWGWLLAAGVAIALAAASTRYLRWRQVKLFRDRQVLVRLFALLGLWAARLRVPWRPSQTPLERAAGLNARLPEGASTVDTIAGLFVAEQYGRQEPPPGAIEELAQAWPKLQPQLWKQWLIRRLRGPDVAA